MKCINTERLPIKMWLDNIEDGAMQQARNLANLPFAFKWIALMPDSHEGYGMPIGGVMATERVIVPNAVGVDIGCGMRAVRLSLTDICTKELEAITMEAGDAVPRGFDNHVKDQNWNGFSNAPDIPVIQQQLAFARRQLGTLGGGNHFMEVQKGDDGHIWLMVHSGSRNFGYTVARYYHDRAIDLCGRWFSALPTKDLSFLPMESDEGKEYYEAMKYCLDFARANRERIMLRLLGIVYSITGAVFEEEIDIHHNYAEFEHHYDRDVLVHRKGATKASAGHVGIIPGSMGTSSYIVEGLGNRESFWSCSHGAGRKMGRAEAKRSLDLCDEQKKMSGIVHSMNDTRDLDEAPGAYKNIDEVMIQQADLVKIKVRLSPLAVVKG